MAVVNVLVLFYSTYGHNYRMASAVVEGAQQVPDANVTLARVPETLSNEILTKMHAIEAQQAFAHVPVANPLDLPNYDVIFIA